MPGGGRTLRRRPAYDGDGQWRRFLQAAAPRLRKHTVSVLQECCFDRQERRLVARLTVTAFVVPTLENSVPLMEMNATFSPALPGT
jgi:hypothetical protein